MNEMSGLEKLIFISGNIAIILLFGYIMALSLGLIPNNFTATYENIVNYA